MSKSLIISERDNIAAVIQDEKVVEFFIHRGDILLGDVYLASVENILPSIDAAFVHVGSDKMGFLHASDVTGKGALKDKLTPKQKILVQVVKEPTGHKGPRVTMSISLPGRFLVLMPDEKGISISKKIASAKERSRLKSIVSLLKPAGVGVIIRTEAEGQSEAEIQEDIELLLEKWNNIVTAADTVTPPNLIYRDQDLLYRVIREACTDDVNEIILDTSFGLHRTNQLLQSWNMNSNIKVSMHKGNDPLLVSRGIDKELRQALQTKVTLPSGGYLFIQQTEALAVIDVNSGKFTSSASQGETIRKTNLEAVAEIARQLKLRNIGGMIIIDFIDMDSRVDKLSVLEELELALEPDKARPQVGQLSDLGLVELTRHRQGQSLAEIFTKKCPACSGMGAVVEEFNFASSTTEGDLRAKASKIRLPQKQMQQKAVQNAQPSGAQAQQGGQQQHKNKIQIQQPQQKHQKKETTNNIPSIVASLFERKKKQEPAKDFKLSEEIVKSFLSTKGHVVNIAKFVKFTSLTPRIANNFMPRSYVKDVFTILQEIESGEFVGYQSVSETVEPETSESTVQPVTEEKIESPEEEKPQPLELVPATTTEIVESPEVEEQLPLVAELQAEESAEPAKKRGRRKTGETATKPRRRTPVTRKKQVSKTEEENE